MTEDDYPLKKVFDRLAKENPKKKKKKYSIPKEKRLQYYSGWGKGKSIKEERIEKQTKLG